MCRFRHSHRELFRVVETTTFFCSQCIGARRSLSVLSAQVISELVSVLEFSVASVARKLPLLVAALDSLMSLEAVQPLVSFPATVANVLGLLNVNVRVAVLQHRHRERSSLRLLGDSRLADVVEIRGSPGFLDSEVHRSSLQHPQRVVRVHRQI